MFGHIMVGADDIEQSKSSMTVYFIIRAEPGVLSVNPTGHKRYVLS